MDADAPLDFALFQLSPRRSRCELVVSSNGRAEKIASGSVKPFVAHLRAAEEQAAAQPPPPAIRLQVERRGGAAWFSKGTLERFVRFVSTPEVLEMANTFDAEMAQLENARKIYSQGVGDPLPGAAAENDTASAAAADITKKELLRAIDVRLSALKQELATACVRASSAGFNPDSVSELLLFADHFGANQLSEACNKFMALCQRRPDLISHQHSPPAHSSQWKSFDDGNVRCSSGSDMSIDEPEVDLGGPSKKTLGGGTNSQIHRLSNSQQSAEGPVEPVTEQQPKPTIQQTVETQEKETHPAPPVPAVPDKPAGAGGSRRLSVQDRINMFESKQKEQTSSSSNSNSAVTGRVVPGKGEHRRVLSSTSMEKLVLRRWSGASDMSIDLSNNDSSSFNDRKENGTSVGTPTSANSEANSKVRADEEASGLKDKTTSCSWSCQKENSNDTSMDSTTTNTCSSSTSNATSSSLSSATIASPLKQTRDCTEDNMVITSSIESGSSFEKEQGVNQGHSSGGKLERGAANAPTRTRLKTSPKLVQEASAKDKATFPTPLSEEPVRMKDQEISAVGYHDIPVASEQIGQKDARGSRPQTREIYAAADGVGIKDQPNRMFGKKSGDVDPKSKASSDSRINFRASSGRDEVASTETEVYDVGSQRKNLPRKAQDVGRKVVVASEIPSLSDGSGRQGTNLSRQSSTIEQELNLRGGKIKLTNEGNGAPICSEKKVKEFAQVSDLPKGAPSEQARVTRLTKGNQERNDELQMKADELEKLFAAHKLRVQSDQVTSSRRGKFTDVLVDNVPKAGEVKPASDLPDQFPAKQVVKDSAANDFDTDLLLKMVDNQEYNNSIQQKLGILSLEESRGKFYEQYMQKRNAKLREEWKLQREQKEAIMKAMHDSLERSKAEMRIKFSRSTNVQDSTYGPHGAKKMPSFQSDLRDKDQGVESLLVEEEMNSDYLSGDGSSRSTDSRKHFSNRVSSVHRTSVIPVPKPPARTSNSGAANRRTTPENPLAQSVPNFSDFRKENTKPSIAAIRATARAQPKSFSCSKSIIEESNSILKEDKSRRSQSMRKSSNPAELKDISSLNEDIFNWAPSRVSKDQVEGAFGYNTLKSGVPKSFLRKGNGVRPIVGVIGLQASMISDVFQNGVYDGLMDHQEDSPGDVKEEEEEEEEEEEYESIEENLRESDFPADSDSENPRISHEFGNSDDPGSENGDISHPGEAATLAATKFNAFAGNMHDLSGELPAPWSSRLPHIFPCANENSDIDAFVDSPTGSPSQWNSHPLDQTMDADVARMRKKWGSAQMPIIGANPAQQSRKDVTKGFKKLLKFGRKNRGVDGLVNDWVSASTASECDDDMEDGRDLAVGSSDDFRKSRMGSLSSYDGFVENEIFSEQAQSLRSSIPNAPANFRLREDHLTGSSLKAPRSFFSLSTFRSKGSDARLR